LPNNPKFPFLNFVQKDTILLSEIFQAGSKTGSLNRERLEFVPNESGKWRQDVMTETEAMVFVVDDDASMRESLRNLIRSVGLRAARSQSKYTAIGIPNLAETAAG
jgi:PleD family two-component response regulator